MRPQSSRQIESRAGRAFTLIELTIVIAIIAVLSTSLIPVVTQPWLMERKSEVLKEMAAIEEGIRGRPELGDYGYLGSMGGLPSSVVQLVQQSPSGLTSAPNPFASTAGVPRGWQGPYIRVQTPFPQSDPWGKPYDILTQNGSNSQLQWMIRSRGADLTPGTSDDLYFPYDSTTWWNAYATTLNIDIMLVNGPSVRPAVLDSSPNDVVTLYVPDGNGSETTATSVVVNGRATFTTGTSFKIPLGMHGVRFFINGQQYDRPIVANQPVSYATVYVNSTWAFSPSSCAFPAGSVTGAASQYNCAMAPSVPVVANQVVETTFSGLARGTGGRCYLAIQLGTGLGFGGPTPGVDDISVDYTFAPGMVPSSAVGLPVSITRTFQYSGSTGAAITPALVIQPASGAVTCTIEAGNLQVKTWAP